MATKKPSSKEVKVKEEKPKKESSPILRRLSLFRVKTKAVPAPADHLRPSTAKDLRSPAERGKGHNFKPTQLTNPTWCDHCDDFIWGLLKQCVQCENCKFTCHVACQFDVVLDCAGVVAKRTLAQELASDRIVQNAAKRAAVQSATPRGQGVLTYLTPLEIQRRIDDYNALTPGLPLQLLDDASGKLFKGSIRVWLNLVRPIKVATEDAVFSRQDVEDSLDANASGRASFARSGSGLARSDASTFYLPKNVSKGLFLQSTTTTHEVISILLTKFKIVTHPRKFALFERNTVDNSTRRLRRFEEPLVLVLLWGGANSAMTLSLQENEEDTQFPWDDFCLAELENFYRILETKEQEHVEQIKKRYEAKRQRLLDAITEISNTESNAMPISDEVVKSLCDDAVAP